jgi:hypothetical protein
MKVMSDLKSMRGREKDGLIKVLLVRAMNSLHLVL